MLYSLPSPLPVEASQRVEDPPRASDDVACAVHGDDFTFEGPPEALTSVAAALRKFWLIKVRVVLGPDASDDKEVSILNRIVEKLRQEAGMEGCKVLSVPIVKMVGGHSSPGCKGKEEPR